MTFIGGLRHDGMTAPWLLDGPIDGPAFITCIKTRLAPTLNKGDVVVLDNLPAHKVAAAQAAIKERGAWLLFLPPYSPDLNPMELAFSKLKAHIKRLVLRTVGDPWKAVGAILELFSKQECANFFSATGYGERASRTRSTGGCAACIGYDGEPFMQSSLMTVPAKFTRDIAERRRLEALIVEALGSVATGMEKKATTLKQGGDVLE